MKDEQRRPAGVDPSMIESARPIDTQARAIGRRVAMKLLALDVRLVRHHVGREYGRTGEEIAAIVEAEVRSSAGTPPLGAVDIRLDFVEALVAVTTIVEAQHSGRSATEEGILADLRAKYFEALGIAPSC